MDSFDSPSSALLGRNSSGFSVEKNTQDLHSLMNKRNKTHLVWNK